jgi:hypothetical protein
MNPDPLKCKRAWVVRESYFDAGRYYEFSDPGIVYFKWRHVFCVYFSDGILKKIFLYVGGGGLVVCNGLERNRPVIF